MNRLTEDFLAVKETLSHKNNAAIFFASLFSLGAVYAVLTDILILNPLGVNPKLDTLNAVLIAIIVFLTSLVLTLTFYRLKKNMRENAGEKTGIIAGILGAFATACPVCQPIWLVWLGLGNASIFLVDYATPIALASIALLLFSLHLAAQAVYRKTCEIGGNSQTTKILK